MRDILVVGAEEHFLRKGALVMESKGIKYYLSVFLFSVLAFLALVFLPSCVVPPSRKEMEKPEIRREKKVDWEMEDEEDKKRKKPEIIWVEIKGGDFQMGSDTGLVTSRPVRRVNIKTFWIAKTEVTVAEYRKCVEAGKCSLPDMMDEYHNRVKNDRENHPVTAVDWDQARAYCKWVGGQLPSEAEWEYAARSRGKPVEYPWGNEKPTCDRAVMDDGGYGCGKGTTWPVCSKPKGNTEQGLCDMAGNVWEWVEDDWHIMTTRVRHRMASPGWTVPAPLFGSSGAVVSATAVQRTFWSRLAVALYRRVVN